LKILKKVFLFLSLKKGGVNNNSGGVLRRRVFDIDATHTPEKKNVPVLIVFKKKLKKNILICIARFKNF
jgi:hypothetical protein